MRRLALVSVMFTAALLGQPAQAQDITQHLDQIGAGSYLVFNSGGRNFTQVFRGQSGKAYVIDLVEGPDPNGQRLSREYRDALGQLIRVDFSNGMSMRFAPHNCQRTLGACEFVQTGSNGATRQGRLVTAVGDGYSYELSVFPSPGQDPVLVESGHLGLDDRGTVVSGQIAVQVGSVQQITLVQAVYR